MKSKIIILIISIFSLSSNAQTQSENTPKTIVLVHGAWSDVSAWDLVLPQLKDKKVITINLPAHGKDQTSVANITLQSYVDEVKKAIGERKNIVLFGHSMAGIVISLVAEQMPSQIDKLVYLAAYTPQNGESLFSLAQQDAGSHTGKYLTVNETAGLATVKREGFADIFFADAPKSSLETLLNNTKLDEPLLPLATTATLTEANFGSVKKFYIYTTQDHAISYDFQQKMVAKSPVSEAFTLKSSHTPFVSQPKKLAKIILELSK